MLARVAIVAVVLTFNLSSIRLRASSGDGKPPDPDGIAALEARASQAQPRDQCFLYAQLVQVLTELSIRQYSAGDVTNATNLLKEVQNLTQKFHLSLADNDKRLKDAQILLSHTAFRLNELLRASSFEDRPLVEQTLADVTQAKDAAMMQVFQK